MALRARLALSCALALSTAAPANERDRKCAEALLALGAAVPDPASNSCAYLKGNLQAALSTPAAPDAVPLEAIEPLPQGNASPIAAGQTTPVPSLAPAGLAAGTLGFSGTQTGPKVVTILSINPLTLPMTDTKKLAWASRTADLTVALPISTSPAGGGASAFEYVGVRLRLNAFGALNGSAALAAATKRYEAFAQSSNALWNQVLQVIDTAPDVVACAKALYQRSERVEAACGAAVGTSLLAESRQALLESLNDLRFEADRQYLGLDLRGDFGDPTFSGDPALRGSLLLGALGYGVRLGGPTNAAMLRLRLGAAYQQLHATPTSPTASVDYGLGLEWASAGGVQSLRFDLGLEGRRALSGPAFGDTNFNDLRLGVGVPLSNGTSISVGVSIPLGASNPHAPILTMAGDWALLLSDFKPR